jgi:hypothetical protein
VRTLGAAAVKRKGAAVVAVAAVVALAVAAVAAVAAAEAPKLRFIFRVEVTVGTKAARGVAPACKYRRNLLGTGICLYESNMTKPPVHLDVRYGIFLKLMPLSETNILLFHYLLYNYGIISELQLKRITKHIIHCRQVATNTKEELLKQNFFLFVYSYLKSFHKFVVLIT